MRVEEANLTAAAEILLGAESPVFIYSRGLTDKEGKTAVSAVLDLAKSVKNAAVLSTKGKANSLAASS